MIEKLKERTETKLLETKNLFPNPQHRNNIHHYRAQRYGSITDSFTDFSSITDDEFDEIGRKDLRNSDGGDYHNFPPSHSKYKVNGSDSGDGGGAVTDADMDVRNKFSRESTRRRRLFKKKRRRNRFNDGFLKLRRRLAATTKYDPDQIHDSQFDEFPVSVPVKAIVLAFVLFLIGTTLLLLAILMMTDVIKIKNSTRIWPLFILGIMCFIPGAYHLRVAFYAYRGYDGFNYTDIPSFDN
ncbi:hypothetical protein SNEBB_009664 [Seison nebaliae]|nr:hypothetical protein SNEBB_009664 [Seison nebaliae]